MNEKIFVFIWFWLVVLSCVTVLSLLYHLFVMMTPSVTKVGSNGTTGFDPKWPITALTQPIFCRCTCGRARCTRRADAYMTSEVIHKGCPHQEGWHKSRHREDA